MLCLYWLCHSHPNLLLFKCYVTLSSQFGRTKNLLFSSLLLQQYFYSPSHHILNHHIGEFIMPSHFIILWWRFCILLDDIFIYLIHIGTRVFTFLFIRSFSSKLILAFRFAPFCRTRIWTYFFVVRTFMSNFLLKIHSKVERIINDLFREIFTTITHPDFLVSFLTNQFSHTFTALVSVHGSI